MIGNLLSELEVHPVLIEVGAIDRPPVVWDSIARHSIYVGIGPGSAASPPRQFYRTFCLDEAVTPEEASDPIVLHLTKDRIYSSLLRPAPARSSAFFDQSCAPDGEVAIRGITLNAAMDRLSLAAIDWLSTNVNGIDLQVFQSVKDSVRGRILAVDTVIDLVDLWVEQGSSIDAYHVFLRDGFWLSRLSPHGFVRMRPESLRRVNELDPRLDSRIINEEHRRAPGWLFARFFRTIDSMAAGEFSKRDYVLLWTFALLDRQIGFAADVAFEYERIFGSDSVYRTMLSKTLNDMRRLSAGKTLLSTAKRFVPAAVRRGLRRLVSS
jgi:hypothetical protein